MVANGDTRTISMFHTHSKESITVTFKANGRYDEAGLAKLNHFLRDWRNHKVTKMNPHLFDILWEVNRDTGGKEPIQIISAFRSSETNEMLRSRSSGVARFSQHVQGNAIDFRIPGVSLAELRAAGLRLQRGGVGFYPGSDFVHMDTSTIRHWPRMTRDQLARVFPDGKTVHVPTDGVPLKNFQQAAAEIQRRGAHGTEPRTQVASASPAPDSSGLQRFITSIFTANSAANPREQEVEDDTPAAQPQTPPARVQVASAAATPRSLLPQATREQQPRERLQWQTGPAPANAPQQTSQEPSEETTGATALAYANPRERNFPPQAHMQGTLAAVPLVAGAHTLPAGFASANAPEQLKHPENVHGFAAPVRAIVENRFEEFRPVQVAAEGFQRNRPQVSVIGFEPTRAASR